MFNKRNMSIIKEDGNLTLKYEDEKYYFYEYVRLKNN